MRASAARGVVQALRFAAKLNSTLLVGECDSSCMLARGVSYCCVLQTPGGY